MYRSARVTDLIIDTSMFLRLLQKVEDGEKSQQVENSCVGNKKGTKQWKRRKKEEEGEEKKYPRGRAAHSLACVDSSSELRFLFFCFKLFIF